MKQCLGLLLACSIAGCASVQREARPPVRVEFRLAELRPGPGLTEMTAAGSGRKVYVHKEVELSNSDIAGAVVRQVTSRPEIRITLTTAGEEKLAKLTQENLGRRLALVVDGALLSAPVIRSKIHGVAVIVGSFTQAEAERIAKGVLGK